MPGNFTITTHKDYQKLIDEPKKVTYYQDGVFVESVEQYKNI
jgi:hypothetical protein